MVTLTDVTLRDGLQMEGRTFSTEQKTELFRRLQSCGYDRLEITSFVHPKWIPQFADAGDFCATALKETAPSDRLMAFVPNEKGLQRLFQYPIGWASAFIATSETFNQKNVNASVADTLASLRRLVELCRENSRKIRIYVSTVFGCPYEGAISREVLARLFEGVVALDPDEIALSDTIGVAVPAQVDAVLEDFLKLYPAARTAMHFHDTYGLALAGIETAYRRGVRSFDGTTGGVGGCPYAKGATGNVATEKIAYLSFRQGHRREYPESAIHRVWDYLSEDLGITLHSPLFEIRKRGGELYGLK